MMRPVVCWIAAACCSLLACGGPPPPPSGFITLAVPNSPNNLDPRVGTDEVSQSAHQLLFDNLLNLDAQLRVVPGLAERWTTPDERTYVVALRQGVRFHDGHELTAADVVHTFSSFLDPSFLSPRKGAYRMLAGVSAVDRYTVRFLLKEPFGSFPINLVMPIVPAGAGATLRDRPIGTGPYQFVDHAPDDQLVLRAFAHYYGGAAANAGIVLKIVPDDMMRGLELRKGTMDIVVNDLAPDMVHQLAADPRLRVEQAPGIDYAYIGLNLRDRVLGIAAFGTRWGTPSTAKPSSSTCGGDWRTGRWHPASGLLCVRARCLPLHARSRRAAAARRSGLSRSGRVGSRATPATFAESVERRVQPAAVGGHSAGSAARRHRARRAHLRVRDPVRRRPDRQLSDVHAAMGRAFPIPTCSGGSSTRGRCRPSASIGVSSPIPRSIG